ncbi:hypothetical protein [Cellulosilyticum sp. I15G10I2]|uniref:hypothetical protein n=1 Tax=Cellulosilyticum sp. I15G10I2 TaxID=1892843 RepID=UPI00085CDC00|nr:hypothetical protein [Cellulosilyticum sp. I15G10I2]
MATYPRHKKARLLRDFMIETDMVKLFKEDETENTILFRTAYPMLGEHKQVVINIDDSIYVGVQTLLIEEVPADKREVVLNCLNDFNLQYPTLKYVLTKDHHVMTSMFFNGDENTFNANLILGTTIQMMKNIADQHYGELKKILG